AALKHLTHSEWLHPQRLDIRRSPGRDHRNLHQLRLLPGGEGAVAGERSQRFQTALDDRQRYMYQWPPPVERLQRLARDVVVGEHLRAGELDSLLAVRHAVERSHNAGG